MTLTTRARRTNPIWWLISFALFAGAGALFIQQLVVFSQNEANLSLGLRVAGVNVGGLERDEAVARWEQVFGEPIVLYYANSPIVLDPSAIGFRISSETMLARALASSAEDGGFWQRFFEQLGGTQDFSAANVPLEASYQADLLRSFLEDIALRYDRGPGGVDYDLSTLTTFTTSSGFSLDIDEAMIQIDSALRSPVNRTLQLPIGDIEAATPSLQALEQLIIAYLDAQGFIHDGQTTVASVFVMDLATGEEISILGDVAYSAASTIKLPIMLEFFRGINRPATQEEAWLLANSLLCSNNASSNLLMRIVGDNDQFTGLQRIDANLQNLGAGNTYITAPFVEGFQGQELGSIAAPATAPNPAFDTGADPFNQTTAEDMGTLFGLVYDCANMGSGLTVAYPDGEYSRDECRQMLELMSANDLQRLLQAGIPEGTRISHKNGWIFDTVGDAGIVYPPNGRDYVIAVFIWEQSEFQDYEKLWPLVEEISRAAWNYFVPEAPLLERRADIPVTAVECFRADSEGTIIEYNYLPPGQEAVDLDNINGWRSD
jgi:beta-lactamase class A